MNLCPTCKQPWEKPSGKVCANCDGKIGRRHKWHFVGGRPQHRDCANPEGYKSAEVLIPLSLGTIPYPAAQLASDLELLKREEEMQRYGVDIGDCDLRAEAALRGEEFLG